MNDDSYAAKVGGQIISNNDFRYGFMLIGRRPASPQGGPAGAAEGDWSWTS